MVQVAEKFRLGQRHAQHRNLQPSKPHPHGRWNAIFGQDALKHQRHHLDDGFFALGVGFFLELGGAVAHHPGKLNHGGGTVVLDDCPAHGAVVGLGLHTMGRQRMGQCRRRGWRIHHVEPRGRLGQQAPQLPHHTMGPLARAGQRCHTRHSDHAGGRWRHAIRRPLPPHHRSHLSAPRSLRPGPGCSHGLL